MSIRTEDGVTRPKSGSLITLQSTASGIDHVKWLTIVSECASRFDNSVMRLPQWQDDMFDYIKSNRLLRSETFKLIIFVIVRAWPLRMA